MTDQEIIDALQAHLETIAVDIEGVDGTPPIVAEDRHGVWDGAKYETPEAPYFLVERTDTPPSRVGYSTTERKSGRFIVNVLTFPGEGAALAKPLAEVLKAHFPLKLSLGTAPGFLKIAQPTEIKAGYNDGTYWRTAVHVRWQAV